MDYLKKNGQNICFAVALLFFPFLFAYNAGNPDSLQRIVINAIYTLIISTVLLYTSGWLRKGLVCLLCVIAFPPNIIVLSYLLMDHVIMKSTDFWVVFNTNPAEAGNLLAVLPAKVYIWAIGYVALVIYCLASICKKEEGREVRVFWQLIAIALLLLVSLVNPFRSKVPMVDFYKSFWKYSNEQREVAEFYKNRNDIKLDVTRLYSDSCKNTLLFIIGESQNRRHMQLYGYARETNPLLTEVKDELVLYNDVCSPAIHTLACMKQMLTFANNEQPDLYKQEANIIEILRAGGYKTYWFDNQSDSKNGLFKIDVYSPTSYRIMAKSSDVYADSQVLDTILVNHLKTACEDTNQNKAIFLHMIGSHFDYSQRYEPTYQYFADTMGIMSPYKDILTQGDIDIINAYDNSNRYTDYIIRSCIEVIRAEGGRSAMLYFSDHGEEVFDDQYYFSRSFERISPAMCEPAFFLWMNDVYKESNNLVIESNRPYCLDDVIHSIMDVAGIRYYLYDSTRSVFSSAYEPKERYVQGIPYKQLLNTSQVK